MMSWISSTHHYMGQQYGKLDGHILLISSGFPDLSYIIKCRGAPPPPKKKEDNLTKREEMVRAWAFAACILNRRSVRRLHDTVIHAAQIHYVVS